MYKYKKLIYEYFIHVSEMNMCDDRELNYNV